VRFFDDGAWRDLAPGLEPRPGAREPWAEAHVETARRFLALVAQTPAPDVELATVEEAATVQRILAAAMASEDDGCRVLLD
jgi:myo-inositol 2-dehydrogenase / D-chiro-inositol 1-dehydrogenase